MFNVKLARISNLGEYLLICYDVTLKSTDKAFYTYVGESN